MPPTLLSRSLIQLPGHLRIQIIQRALNNSPAITLSSASASRTYATYNTTFESSNSHQTSVNHDEVNHFNALASSWWDPHGSSRLLHLMNPLRHQFLRRCLTSSSAPPSNNLKLLDIGCGGGIFAESAARLPTVSSVAAIDPTPAVIAVARRHQRTDPLLLEPDRLTYHNLAIEDLPLPASPAAGFDVISVFEVLEHVRAPAAFLETALKHLKPGGWVVGSTIARTGVSWFTTKFVAEEVLGLVPRGTHDWEQYIQPGELREWARGNPELDVMVGGDGWQVMGVVYVPGMGWREVQGSEEWGNYFFGVRKVEEGAES